MKRLILVVCLTVLAVACGGADLPPPDDPRIPVIVAWLEESGQCVEDSGCLPEVARHIIAENEALGITDPQEMIEHTEEASDS